MMRARRFLLPTSVAGLLTVVVLSAGGCRQLTSISTKPEPPDRTLTCGGLHFPSGDCAECVGTSCCDEAESCAATDSCGDLARCLALCAPGNGACSSDCRARFPPAAAAEATTLQSCQAAHCASACGVVCGGYVYPNGACADCGAAHCCLEATECMADAACAALATCERACSTRDADCVLACELRVPTGVTRARAFGACIAGACRGTCIGPEWACLQKPPAKPPPPTGPPITVTYRFADYETFQPIAGLRVRPCGATDLQCQSPVAPAVTTDATGAAVVHLGSNTFDGYAEVTSPDYATVLSFHPPLSKDFVTGIIPIPKKKTFDGLVNELATIQPDRSTIIFTAADCTGARAPGVRFAIEPVDGATPFYFANRIPSVAATETDGVGGFAAGGFVNVRTNTAITVHASVAANNLALAPAVVFARPDPHGFTAVDLFATTP